MALSLALLDYEFIICSKGKYFYSFFETEFIINGLRLGRGPGAFRPVNVRRAYLPAPFPFSARVPEKRLSDL
jgi:hypothetical protein